jgi:fatty acid/phospholipid biosynthesis enzyme
MTSMMWSQSSQQEKLEQRNRNQQIRENEKMLTNVKSKEKSAMNILIQKIRLD